MVANSDPQSFQINLLAPADATTGREANSELEMASNEETSTEVADAMKERTRQIEIPLIVVDVSRLYNFLKVVRFSAEISVFYPVPKAACRIAAAVVVVVVVSGADFIVAAVII